MNHLQSARSLLLTLTFTISLALGTIQAASAQVISEILAGNKTDFVDEDGDSSDWIEINNPTSHPIELKGHYLTDDPAELLKWEFPAATLAPGGYLVVFASGKNRAIAGAELHTNFSLGSGGEFLALVKPDGLAIASQFAPAYPEQIDNVSYGRGIAALPSDVTLIEPGADSRWFVPDAEPANDWRIPEFDDSSWNSALTGIGFDYDDLTGAGGNTEDQMQSINASAYLRVPFLIENPAGVLAMTLRMKFEDGFVAYINGQQIASDNAPEQVAFDSTATTSHRDADARVYIDYTVDFSGKLVAGTNILAIQGMNATTGGSDFLILPELTATIFDTNQPALVGFFESPSPGAPNGNLSFLGIVEDTAFSVDRGFYDAPFDIEITSATAGAKIYYTTDGSTPSEQNGDLYTGPVTISNTTTLRAIATLPGFQPTNVDTHSYFFLDDVITQYADGVPPEGWPLRTQSGQTFNYGMDPDITERFTPEEMKAQLSAIPTMSIVTDLPNLVDSRTGIYTHPGSRGRTWERPASLELVDPLGNEEGFQINCGLRIRGGFSRSGDNPKHAFRLFFRNDYGSGKLNYPLFGTEGADVFENMDLRTSQNYSWSFQNNNANTYLREVFSRDTQRDMGRTHTRSRYYHLYVDGVYWGLYMTQERAEAAFGATYFGGDPDDYDTIKSAGSPGGYNTEATDGELNGDWRTLWNLTRAQFANPTLERYMEIQGLNPDGTRNPALPVLLDVPSLIDHTLTTFYTGSFDSPLLSGGGGSNNWFGIRNRVSGDMGFVFFCHDGEHSMGVNGTQNMNRVGPFTGDQGNFSKSNPQFLHQDLARTDEYKMLLADHVYRHYFNDGLLTPEKVAARIEQRRAVVDKVIDAEAARWGDSKRTSNPYDREDWEAEVRRLFSYVERRTDTVLTQIKRAKLYPDTTPPEFNQRGGQVPDGFVVQLVNETGEIYLTRDGSDPRMIGGGINPSATRLSGSTEAVPMFEAGATWKYLDNGSLTDPSWTAPAFDDSAWASGPAEFGYGDRDEATVVGFGDNGSSKFITTWFRKTITVSRASAFLDLTLQVLRDDGVVVYLNGTEVARDNLPEGTIAPETLALQSVSSNDESSFFSFPVPPSLLVEGTNVIAVEIHQASAGNSDISFDAALSGTRATLSDSPIALNRSTTLRARSLNGDEWSALTEATFYIGTPASAANLVFSEINYHPAPPTEAEAGQPFVTDDSDFEFIELQNIGAGTIDLSGLEFTRGIDFQFPVGTVLGSNSTVLIVKNRQAFQLRYSSVPATLIIGEFGNDSSLSNSGESLAIAGADSSIIRDFRYNDKAPWPESADGDGPTLQLRSPGTNPDHATGESWRASSTLLGTPGSVDTSSGTGYATWATSNGVTGGPESDDDNDGVSNFLEFALRSPPLSASAHLLPVASEQTLAINGTTARHLTFTYRRNPDASGLAYAPETSTDLQNWSNSGQMALVSSSPTGDGSETVIYRSVQPLPAGGSLYVRLRVSE
ncbi:MAG: lamin tail domain-containing protein [Verrucomicrobiae bacterium]|nr:lamin tail domain-containing protein [Verrucomicrobiae bacterium]